MSILETLRPELRSLQPYQAAEQIDDTIRLNANDEILKRSIKSNEYFCIDGLEKRKRT